MGQPRARRGAPPPGKTLEDLRPLLVGPEQRRIRRIEERLDKSMAGMVAGVLPEAVIESRKKGEALSWALDPLINGAIHDRVRRDPGSFAEAISPALGPAIRRAVGSQSIILKPVLRISCANTTLLTASLTRSASGSP